MNTKYLQFTDPPKNSHLVGVFNQPSRDILGILWFPRDATKGSFGSDFSEQKSVIFIKVSGSIWISDILTVAMNDIPSGIRFVKFEFLTFYLEQHI